MAYFNIADATFSQSINTQDSYPRGIAWNNDGTKLYEIGVGSDKIYEYDVSTPYDIATATYSQSINTQDSIPRGMAWNNDGTKLYEVGTGSDKIYEYDVSTPYDIATATYSQSINTQDVYPQGMAWNGDGSKLYEIGDGSDKIYEYDVSTPYDIATATYSQSINTQDSIPIGMAWNNDGSKLYEIGVGSDKIYEYDVSTPYDIATATFSQSINTQDSSPTGITWNNDGSKMYEIGLSSDKIYEYDVTPAPTASLTYLTNWSFSKEIPITGQSHDVTNYQIPILIGESVTSGTNDLHVEGNSDSFPTARDESGDLRFTDVAGNVYDMWVEKVTGSAGSRVAKCWVEVGANLNTNPDIYIQYGNSGASNVSNGEDTFLFFDDFDTFDTNKWTRSADGNTGNVFVSGGYLQVEQNVTDDSIYAESDFVFPDQYRWVARSYVHRETDQSYSARKAVRDENSGQYIGMRYGWRDYGSGICSNDNSENFYWEPCITGETIAPYLADQWFEEEVAFDRLVSGQDNVYGRVNSTEATTERSLSAVTGDAKMEINGYGWFTGHYIRTDYIGVCKWRADEPAIGTVGAEQEPATTPTASPIAHILQMI